MVILTHQRCIKWLAALKKKANFFFFTFFFLLRMLLRPLFFNTRRYQRFYNTGLLKKTTVLPDKVGLCLSKFQG